jgi:uridine kinase
VVAFEELENRIRTLLSERKMVVVGLDGKSGVGKSTAAAFLAARLGGHVIDGDSFFAGGTALRDEPAPLLADQCIDRVRLAATIRQLREGAAASYHPFDWGAFDGRLSADPITIPAAALYVVDGTYSCHPDYGDLVDLRVLAHASDATRHTRLLAREAVIGPWERQWHDAESWYFTALMPPERFDCVIDLEAPAGWRVGS